MIWRKVIIQIKQLSISRPPIEQKNINNTNPQYNKLNEFIAGMLKTEKFELNLIRQHV